MNNWRTYHAYGACLPKYADTIESALLATPSIRATMVFPSPRSEVAFRETRMTEPMVFHQKQFHVERDLTDLSTKLYGAE